MIVSLKISLHTFKIEYERQAACISSILRYMVCTGLPSSCAEGRPDVCQMAKKGSLTSVMVDSIDVLSRRGKGPRAQQ